MLQEEAPQTQPDCECSYTSFTCSCTCSCTCSFACTFTWSARIVTDRCAAAATTSAHGCRLARVQVRVQAAVDCCARTSTWYTAVGCTQRIVARAALPAYPTISTTQWDVISPVCSYSSVNACLRLCCVARSPRFKAQLVMYALGRIGSK